LFNAVRVKEGQGRRSERCETRSKTPVSNRKECQHTTNVGTLSVAVDNRFEWPPRSTAPGGSKSGYLESTFADVEVLHRTPFHHLPKPLVYSGVMVGVTSRAR